MKVIEIDLAERIPAIRSQAPCYEGVYVLARFRGQPLGWVTLKIPGKRDVSPEQLLEAVAERLGGSLLRAVLERQLHATSGDRAKLFSMSIVVCTRDRPDRLCGCLESLLSLDYPSYEVIVVDNAPSNDDAARLCTGLPIRYVREERPGLDRARNRGIAEARSSIVAFTDDDALPDRNWLKAISCAFAERDVMAVTGPVIPAELETDAQILFELGYGGMGHGFLSRKLKLHKITPRELLWSSGFGVGCNMAFRREVFKSIGLFDVVLDVGTPSMGGGDVEMFHRLIAGGHTLAYEPSALVRHLHRLDMAGLTRQLFHNGRGFGCYLFSCARNPTIARRSILNFAMREWFWGWILRRFFRPGILPRRLILAELAGMLGSPLAYRASRAQAIREHRRELRKRHSRIRMPFNA